MEVMDKKWWSRFEKNNDYIVFPLAITWQDSVPMYLKHISMISIHFLCWHFGFWFERKEK